MDFWSTKHAGFLTETIWIFASKTRWKFFSYFPRLFGKSLERQQQRSKEEKLSSWAKGRHLAEKNVHNWHNTISSYSLFPQQASQQHSLASHEWKGHLVSFCRLLLPSTSFCSLDGKSSGNSIVGAISLSDFAASSGRHKSSLYSK